VLSCQQQLAWERDGHIVVQGLLPADDVAQIAKVSSIGGGVNASLSMAADMQ
jgi:hypothetical protein